jgi:DNA-binding MarR family transcriptional regulator
VSSQPTVPWLNDAEMAFWLAFLTGNRRLMETLDSDLQTGAGIELNDYEVLANLSESADHRMRMTDLADQVIMSKNKLTYRIDRMVESGLVRREACTSDRRVQYAVLTPAGMKLLRKAAPLHVRSVRHHLLDQLRGVDLGKLTSTFEQVGTTTLP